MINFKYKNNSKEIKNKNNLQNISKDELINRALRFHSNGNILEAVRYYKYFINKGLEDSIVFSNYALILKNKGKLKEAELFQRKAIELNPDFANAYSNLGNLLRETGKLEEAKSSTIKAIEINPNFAEAHQNLGMILKDLGKLKEAELSTRKAIKIDPNQSILYSNLGIILEGLGNLEEAELSIRKAIKKNPYFAEAHLNLGIILIDLGKLKEAESSIIKALEIEANLTKAYFSLSILNNLDNYKTWQRKLFSPSVLNKKKSSESIDIYFARANILHKKKNYKESEINLQLANELKLNLKGSNCDLLINKSKLLLLESKEKEIDRIDNMKYPKSIFIVGMPRSGSTLVESILSMNSNVNDLGETNLLEESFKEWKTIDRKLTLAKLYLKKINKTQKEFKITTNKCLYNYQYAGIISLHIPNVKIIHCHRNPLDNILSIYRTHFAQGNEYSSSLIDCTKVYLDQEEIMTKYKNRFPNIIYDLNYDLLVRNPEKEIKSLIYSLGWDWNNSYLSPHLNTRSVSTASNVQVRSQINSKSIGGWRYYKNMLKPVIEIVTNTERYQELSF